MFTIWRDRKYFNLENTSGDMRMPSDLQLVYMLPRKFHPIVKYEHYQKKFQVKRKAAYH